MTTMRTTQRTPARAIGLLVLLALASAACPTVAEVAEKNAESDAVVNPNPTPRVAGFRGRVAAGNVAKHRARVPKSASKYYNGDRAGHNLLSRPSAIGMFGLEIPEQLNAEQVIEAAGLEWTAQKKEAHVPTGKLVEGVYDASGAPLEIPEFEKVVNAKQKIEQFTVHSETNLPFGKVGEGYQIYQHSNAIRTVHEMTGQEYLDWEFVGEYKGGANMAAALILPEDSALKPLVFNNGGEDEVLTPYLLVSNSHDGTAALKFSLIVMRMMCWNAFAPTLGAAAAGRQSSNYENRLSFSLRHNQNIHENVGQLTNLLAVGQAYHEEYLNLCEAMIDTEITEDELFDFWANALIRTGRATTNFNRVGDDRHGIENTWGFSGKGMNILNRLMEVHQMPQNNVGVMNNTVFGALQSLLDDEDHEAVIDNNGHIKETRVANTLTDQRVKNIMQTMAIDVACEVGEGRAHLEGFRPVPVAGEHGEEGEVIMVAHEGGGVTEYVVPAAETGPAPDNRNIDLD